MGALNPLLLAAAAFAAVPLFLHLFQRQETRRLSFPALRYLERTEREHARRIRTRQLLLLLLRVAAVLLLAAAGARPFFRGAGSAHPPTALAVVLDNSLSSGRVVDGERVLDRLKVPARLTLAAAGPEDRIWVLLAGEPWRSAAPMGSEEALGVLAAAEPTDVRADLRATLARARDLVSSAGPPEREIHLLSDLQASAFTGDGPPPAGDVPVVLWTGEADPAANRALSGLTVGGGLPPLAGQRTEVTVALEATGSTDTAEVPVRVVVDGRVRSAASLVPGTAVTLPLPPAAGGWVVGTVDTDPDALRADDRRHFAFRPRPAPSVSLGGDPGLFVAEALAVLEEAGRVRTTAGAGADLLLAPGAEGTERAGTGSAVVLLAPADPALLPAHNRRLREAGIPWTLLPAEGSGEVPLDGRDLPAPLRGASASRWYRLVPDGSGDPSWSVLAAAGGDPWAVEGTDGIGRRYLLLASPLEDPSTSLPLSASMVGFVDWMANRWALRGPPVTEAVAGSELSAPPGAEAVRLPSGLEIPLDGSRRVRATGEAGVYAFLHGDTAVSWTAVNPDPAESVLEPLDPARYADAVGDRALPAEDAGSWGRTIFVARRGPELGRFLAAAALLVLLVEALVAATGRQARRRGSDPGPGEAHAAS